MARDQESRSSSRQDVASAKPRAHELGHQLGLRDEYIDASVPNRANGAAPGVRTDHSIMGNYYAEGVAEADVRQRHGDQLAADISATTGQRFTAERSSTCIVREGDTLWGIALRMYGDGNRWPDIYELNRERIEDPDHLLPGWELRVP